MRKDQIPAIPLWTGAVVLLAGDTANAYIGPGVGLSAIGTVIALFGALVLAIIGFVWYPMKRLMKKKRVSTDPSERKVEDASRLSRDKDDPASR